MPFKKPNTPKSTKTFNKHGLYLRWPRIWIIILGLILIFLCFAIAGMEVGHTIFDLYRSTAFGGFIVFIPLLICAIFVMITACKPNLILLRITVILCFIMIILCMALIAYDVLVLIDPTRCFFLNCNYAVVNISNSTNLNTVTGWPLYITWPDYFQLNMNAKRIFQSIQILLAGLFILFTSLYLLTYYIYRHIRLQQQAMYNPDRRTYLAHEPNRQTPVKSNNHVNQPYTPYNSPPHKVTTYTIDGQQEPPILYQPSPTILPKNTKSKTFIRTRSNSVSYEHLCTRCNREPPMILSTFHERQNYFAHLCAECNYELENERRKTVLSQTKSSRVWKP